MLTIAPGVVAMGWPDIARRERTAERGREAARKATAELAVFFAEHGVFPEAPEPTREVTEWSAKSRARMTRTLAELDYGPLLRLGLKLPMSTLTYPGDWLPVAPTGKAVKRHLDQFFKRFARAWGFEWPGLWKLEFQLRGAPHIHLWGPRPEGPAGELRSMTQTRYRPAVGDGLPYEAWLAVVWADIVDHPDPEQRRRHGRAGTSVDLEEGARMIDPRRLAVYFTKHGQFQAKEYQHRVPEEWQAPGCGPGRFWGYKGLAKATAGVELAPADAVFVARTMRRLARSQGVTKQVTVRRTRGGGQVVSAYPDVIGLAGAQYLRPLPARTRRVRRPVVRLPQGAGFLCVNDGPAIAAGLARALERRIQSPEEARRTAESAESKLARLRDRRARPGGTGLSKQ
ncbi:hypothetical protein AB0G74_33900 [Streptomyces sp. NPDC020875]|uniref:hypothetical protein n=1 Tax=Streptomyces sp. NPDC020875 TaxID=3154898 RepID=UPI0033D3E49E